MSHKLVPIYRILPRRPQCEAGGFIFIENRNMNREANDLQYGILISGLPYPRVGESAPCQIFPINILKELPQIKRDTKIPVQKFCQT